MALLCNAGHVKRFKHSGSLSVATLQLCSLPRVVQVYRYPIRMRGVEPGLRSELLLHDPRSFRSIVSHIHHQATSRDIHLLLSASSHNCLVLSTVQWVYVGCVSSVCRHHRPHHQARHCWLWWLHVVHLGLPTSTFPNNAVPTQKRGVCLK